METSEVARCPQLSGHVCICGQEKCCWKWKYVQPSLRKSFAPNHPTISNVSLSNETTSKLSYQYPSGFQSTESFKPKARPHPYNFPIGADTTTSLSYLPPTISVKEQYPWAMRKYVPSNIKLASETIYKLSYTLPGEFEQIDGCNNCGCP